MVLLNGTSQTTIYWEPHARAFAKHFKVLRYDARAQGKTEIGNCLLSAEVHIGDLKNLLEFTKAGQSHLVGISHGAYIALGLAATAPEYVDRLVLCSIGRDSQTYVNQIVRVWHQILQRADLETMALAMMPLVFGRHFLNRNRDILDKMVTAVALRNDKAALMAHFEAMSDYPSPDMYAGSVQCPTLVISGSDDPIVSSAEARKLAQDCHGRYEILPQTGHSIPAESPALFQRMVLEFLSQQ